MGGGLGLWKEKAAPVGADERGGTQRPESLAWGLGMDVVLQTQKQNTVPHCFRNFQKPYRNQGVQNCPLPLLLGVLPSAFGSG